MYDAVVLDNDGVLVGLSGPDLLAEAIERTYRAVGVPSPSDADRAALGLGTSPERVRRACERHGLDPAAVWARRDRTVSELERAAIRSGEKPLYDDIDALSALSVPLGVASNNVRATVACVLDRAGLADRVGAVRARRPRLESLERRKPDPYLVRRALADLGVEPRRALFVGDSASDVVAADRAGADAALLVRPGRDPPDDLPTTPEHTVASLADLPSLVAGDTEGARPPAEGDGGAGGAGGR
ncbi:MAG: HAD family hydrolase [Haloferacaceae archaeon]